jgi:glycosyltransferase involved in cell wall biosynthesis
METYSPTYTVLIPAHDEEATIGACLNAIGPSPGGCVTIVVCNGCTDATPAVARSAPTLPTVIETGDVGKWNAINIGLQVAAPGSVIVVDADVSIDRAALDALAAAVAEPGVKAASPGINVDIDGADAWVKAYYRVFQQHDYLAGGVGASGVYAISAVGRSELGSLPPVIADDGYVRSFFAPHEQRRVFEDRQGRPVHAVVRPPRRLSELLRTEARWRAGDREVRAALAGRRGGAARATETPQNYGDGRRSAGTVRARDLFAYFCIKAAGRLLLWRNRMTRTADVWYRDASSRSAS